MRTVTRPSLLWPARPPCTRSLHCPPCSPHWQWLCPCRRGLLLTPGAALSQTPLPPPAANHTSSSISRALLAVGTGAEPTLTLHLRISFFTSHSSVAVASATSPHSAIPVPLTLQDSQRRPPGPSAAAPRSHRPHLLLRLCPELSTNLRSSSPLQAAPGLHGSWRSPDCPGEAVRRPHSCPWVHRCWEFGRKISAPGLP